MAFKTLTDALKDVLKDRADDLKFFGRKAIYPIDAMNVAEIKLSWSGSSNDYTKLVVSIQHKENGTIASNDFIFEEYLKRKPNDNPSSKTVPKMKIWDSHDIDWYIVYPESTKPICDSIFEYIEMYR